MGSPILSSVSYKRPFGPEPPLVQSIFTDSRAQAQLVEVLLGAVVVLTVSDDPLHKINDEVNQQRLNVALGLGS